MLSVADTESHRNNPSYLVVVVDEEEVLVVLVD